MSDGCETMVFNAETAQRACVVAWPLAHVPLADIVLL